jgi:predicted nucleic acid-binding protein
LTVYVESNFVLELALGQEQATAAESILASAERREVALAVPWFSLAEPFSTVERRSRDRDQFIGQMKRHLQDLRRSQHRRVEARALALGADRLTRVNTSEADDLIVFVGRLVNAATVIPIEAPVFERAMDYRARFGFSPQDALVYAAVVRHLTSAAAPGPHVFVTTDQSDFKDRGIARELRALDCQLVFEFSDVALMLERSSE